MIMENLKSYELMTEFIKSKAEKYKTLDERNAFVESRIYDGYEPTEKEQEEATNNFNARSMEALEGEYRLINFLSRMKLTELNSFASIVRHYSQNKEKEMKELSRCLLPGFIDAESCKKIEYFEKYERPSIKDLLYMIVRQKGKVFGMTDEEAYLYAGREMKNLIYNDILTLDMEELEKKEKTKIRK